MANMERRETPLSIRQFLPMLPAPRPIEAEWKCKRSGDCCTKPLEVIMTKEEAAVLVHAAPPQIVMHFRPIEGSEGRYVALKAQPCPLFVFNGCLVYNSRPYNCRRFGCMRPDPKTEPFEIDSPYGSLHQPDGPFQNIPSGATAGGPHAAQGSTLGR
jgi:Fe-S-cluster containining protein